MGCWWMMMKAIDIGSVVSHTTERNSNYFLIVSHKTKETELLLLQLVISEIYNLRFLKTLPPPDLALNRYSSLSLSAFSRKKNLPFPPSFFFFSFLFVSGRHFSDPLSRIRFVNFGGWYGYNSCQIRDSFDSCFFSTPSLSRFSEIEEEVERRPQISLFFVDQIFFSQMPQSNSTMRWRRTREGSLFFVIWIELVRSSIWLI